MAYSNENGISSQESYEEFFQRKSIQEQCTEETLMHLHNAFMIVENEELSISQLYKAFENILKIKLSHNEFQMLFRKINLKGDGYVTWDEFISYLLLEFREKDMSVGLQTLELLLADAPQMINSCHRSPICKIIFCPEVLPDRSTSFHRGCYLTISKDGIINYWSLDFKYERSVQSTNPYLRVKSTIITDMIVLPDIQIVCTSSSERDLRFYNSAAKKFDLRIIISSFECAIVCMYYFFSKNVEDESYIILGDTNGSIKVMAFSPMDKGPFKQQPGHDILSFHYEDILKGGLKGLKVTEIKNVHKNWVDQVAYYETIRAFLSCSKCSNCSLLLSDLTGTKRQYKFALPLGISCFTFCEESQILATGGPDCIVRIWNPFVPKRASIIFQGHHTTICALVIQNFGKRVYSLSKDRCIKVWDTSTQSCIQTYNGLPSELSEYTPMSIVYNTLTHKMIIASIMIAIVVCEQIINPEISDGFTHTKPVSCVLYNHLFKLIVSTGLDSYIIIWNPWLGQRVHLIKNAHSCLLYGQKINVEITAACFDGSEQLLLTGGQDGSLKIWNFNTGICIRNMITENQCQITAVAWLENRILCTGWNKIVTEYAVTESDVHKKVWGAKHTDDILCSAMRYPQAFATASYNGELILWRLETGQPYRRYQVNDPTARYTIAFGEKGNEKFAKSVMKTTLKQEMLNKSMHIKSSTYQQSALNIIQNIAARSMLFLTTRPMKPNVGTLLVSLDSGIIQVWSHHPGGGFLKAFSVTHTSKDCATSLATDSENIFLVTGHKIGYIKVWLLQNYLTSNTLKPCMPLLKLKFPFLWKDRINGRAKRAVQDQNVPILLSSVRGHMTAIVTIQIISDAQIIVSGSTDHTIRLWSFGGRYLNTLGTFKKWSPIIPNIPVHKYFDNYKLPADVKRFGSFTTMKVLKGGLKQTEFKDKDEEMEALTKQHKKEVISSILDDYYNFPIQTRIVEKPAVLDSSLAYVPIYTHLIMYPLDHVNTTELSPTLFAKNRKFVFSQRDRKSPKIRVKDIQSRRIY